MAQGLPALSISNFRGFSTENSKNTEGAEESKVSIELCALLERFIRVLRVFVVDFFIMMLKLKHKPFRAGAVF